MPRQRWTYTCWQVFLISTLCVVATGCGRSAHAARRSATVAAGRGASAVTPTPTTGKPPSASAPALPLAGDVIGIDPGHNGGNASHSEITNQKIWNGRELERCNTTGTETAGGYTEAAYTFAVATDLATLLRAAGARVVATRSSNTGVGPCVNTRAAILNAAHVDVGIDIHADGGPASGRGFAVLEPVPDGPNDSVVDSSKQFGLDVRAALLGTGMPTSTYDGRDGLVLRDDLAGLNLTTVPLVLVETGNMRNATDAGMLESAVYQRSVARALFVAITHFLSQERGPSPTSTALRAP